MSSELQNNVRAVQLEARPLTLDEISARLAGTPPLVSSKNPAQTVKNALTNDPACPSAGDGRHGYLREGAASEQGIRSQAEDS